MSTYSRQSEHEAYALFADTLAETGDLKAAAKAIGVSMKAAYMRLARMKRDLGPQAV